MKNSGTKIFTGIVIIAALLFCGVLFGQGFSLSEGDVSDLSELFGEEFGGASALNSAQHVTDIAEEEPQGQIQSDGEYTAKEDIAAYLAVYSHLPDNFITKDEARKLGWDGGDLYRYAPGKCIGGDVFGNYEGLLPDTPTRTWYECDVNYSGGSRGAERIVFSDDGLIYYTADHYESFEEVTP